ncbi:MAG: hypothetical protein L0177_06925 [Chloroflexi bacterium]|nr:hypothetical protein [Chloroflexota bacterium]
MFVQAAQHIYANVEKERSPRGIGGFQTLLYTESFLSEDDVASIETRTVYHPFGSHPTKLAFFRLDAGRFVVGRVIPQQNEDRFGRRGGYLAHSFIFSSEDFSRLNNNPFVALELLEDLFADSTDNALERGTPGSIDLPATSLEVNAEVADEAEELCLGIAAGWEPDELKKLAQVVLNVKGARDRRSSLALVGAQDEITGALQAAFSLTPRRLRPFCDFDTHAYGSNPVASQVWARGYPGLADAPPQFVVVDAARKKVGASLAAPVTALERWLFPQTDSGRLTTLRAELDLAFQMSLMLQEESYDVQAVRSAPPELVGHFFERSRERVAQLLSKRLTSAVGPALKPHLSDWLETTILSSDATRVLGALMDGFDTKEIAQRLYDVFQQRRPSSQEAAELDTLARKTEHSDLLLLSALWKQDFDALRGILNSLSHEQCREAASYFMERHSVPVAMLLTPRHTMTVVEAYVEAAGRNPSLGEQAADLAKALMNSAEESAGVNALDSLAPLIRELDARHVKSIISVVKKRQDSLPRAFSEALAQRAQADDSGRRFSLGRFLPGRMKKGEDGQDSS